MVEKFESKNVTGGLGGECEWVDQNNSVIGEKRPSVREGSSGWECESEIRLRV